MRSLSYHGVIIPMNGIENENLKSKVGKSTRRNREPGSYKRGNRFEAPEVKKRIMGVDN